MSCGQRRNSISRIIQERLDPEHREQSFASKKNEIRIDYQYPKLKLLKITFTNIKY